MNFDPNNPVVKLCVSGMELEAQGKIAEAHELFEQAWNSASNDFERFTAAHYLARNQQDPKDNLYWNREALRFALILSHEGVKPQLPSLYLNVAKSHEILGEVDEAKSNYQAAAEHSVHLPEGGYGSLIKSGINAGLKRTNGFDFNYETIDKLIDGWCERRELKPLSLLLPAYLQNLGTESDINKLITALSYISASKCLNADDQQRVDELVVALEKS
ncbi:MAG TPA: hypothetical protein VIM55_20880 [Mucilaginibacter sp.]